ncbi:hypothetical protein OIU84_020327 [Salix udensis]|uniref:F-box domain-containing protein n=1 Tax=Salix udensis TaxID=889485 RepID=A0AAD6KS03_9ROSI|nr:hypothetical protein OIU84_020327 [Salix udensis]
MIQEVITIRFLARIVRLGNSAEHPFVFQFFSLNSGSVTNPVVSLSLLLDSEGLDRSSQIEFHRPHSFEIVASCNGVVSLRVRHREFDGSWRLILWNPSIKKTLYLPPPMSSAKKVKRDRIPEHFVTKILLKTPIKSILRFRCVSQSWNSLVTLPYFIKEHLANAKPLILRTENQVVSLSLLLDSEGLDSSSQIEFHRPHSFEIVASCNGVVSLRVRHREFDGSWRLILWNPSIKKTLYLPPPMSSASTVTTLLCLGYDPRSDYYKILPKTPIKSILRFRCVSQSWNSLVTLPYFIKEHLANAKPLILRTENQVVSLSLLLDCEGLDSSSQIEFHRPHSFEIVASRNGVVALRVRHREFDGKFGGLFLWNPSIKKTLYLPPPRSFASTVTTLLGLGYDPRSDDYKVPR